MSAILGILDDAHRQAVDLDASNERGTLSFWSLIRAYSEAALDLAYQREESLAALPEAVVFSPPVLRQPRLRAFLAPYDFHRYLYLEALTAGGPPERLEATRSCDEVVHRVFLGFPEPGYVDFPGMPHFLAQPEAALGDIRLQEAFILRRLDLSQAEAEKHFAQLKRSLRAYLPRAAQQPTGSAGRPESPREAGLPHRGGTLGPGYRDVREIPEEVDSIPRTHGPPSDDAEEPHRGPMGGDPPAPAPHEDGHLYRVWYATTRRPADEEDPGQGYANEVDPDERIHHGYCDVLIPESHKFGSVGSPAWNRWLTPWRPDDRLRIEEIERLKESLFLDTLRREFVEREPEDRVALVYIHGYRTSFADAAIRAAQIGCDLKIPGATAFFSWHSQGDLEGYFADGEAVQEAEPALRQFLLRFARDVDAEKVHLIAHSMGNQGLARVVQDIARDVTEESGKPFAQIVLAAPDISQSLFRRLAEAYPKISERTTLYISRKDKALWLSRWLQDTPRAGFTPPLTVVDNIDTVEVTNIDLTFLGHGYWADAEPVIYDMKELFDDNKPPGRRARLREVPGPPRFWVVGR